MKAIAWEKRVKISSRFIKRLKDRVKITSSLYYSILELNNKVKEAYNHYYRLQK